MSIPKMPPKPQMEPQVRDAALTVNFQTSVKLNNV